MCFQRGFIHLFFKFIIKIFLEGGGWCYDEQDCLSRSKTVLGSSKQWQVYTLQQRCNRYPVNSDTQLDTNSILAWLFAVDASHTSIHADLHTLQIGDVAVFGSAGRQPAAATVSTWEKMERWRMIVIVRQQQCFPFSLRDNYLDVKTL